MKTMPTFRRNAGFAVFSTCALIYGGVAVDTDEDQVKSKEDHCPVTRINDGRGGVLENDALAVTLPSEEGILSKPDGPGHMLQDGSLAWKFAWNRKREGRLAIHGRRLDAKAAALWAQISDAYGNTGFQPVYLIFPTPGCWEVTGKLNDTSLAFVILARNVEDRGTPGGAW